jgi:Fe-S-cluster containining protein
MKECQECGYTCSCAKDLREEITDLRARLKIAEKALAEDTLPLFMADEFEVEDWARNNMTWAEVRAKAELMDTQPVDREDGWDNPTETWVDQYDRKLEVPR